jgi:hypothetical protein
MTIQELGNIGEFLAAIATVATLVYLAAQIRQTNLISKSDSAKDLLQRFDDLNQLLVTDASLRHVLNKRSGHTPDELDQVYAFANFKCNLLVSAQTAYSAGRIDTNLYLSVKKDVGVSVDVWPVTRAAILLWRERYPDLADMPLFDEL